MARSIMYDLAWEVKGEEVEVEQGAGFGEVTCVTLHALHVRHLATVMGLLQGDEDAWRRVSALERKLLVLRDRCEHLENWLLLHSDSRHADLSYEQTYSEATADLAREFCAELPPSVGAKPAVPLEKTQPKPSANPKETQRVNAGGGDQAGLALEDRP